MRGTITALDGNVLSVKSRDGKDLKVHLAPDAGVTTAKAVTLDELKGKYVGVTAVEKDGRLVARRGARHPAASQARGTSRGTWCPTRA